MGALQPRFRLDVQAGGHMSHTWYVVGGTRAGPPSWQPRVRVPPMVKQCHHHAQKYTRVTLAV